MKLIRKIKKHLLNKSNEYKDRDPKIEKSLIKDAEENNVKKVFLKSNRPSSLLPNKKGNEGVIVINKKTGHNAQLAHEVGHAYYVIGKGKKSLGGRIHKLDKKINEPYSNLAEKLSKGKKDGIRGKELKAITGSTVSGLSGVAAGYKAEEEKEKGNKKKARLISTSSLAVPVLGHAPELGREIAASSKGMKYLKKAGANKQQLKGSRKDMAYALGTYGVNLGKNLVINSGGQLVGKGAYKLTHKKKKDKKDDNTEK